ncbi:MAG: BLUF domain-containing protein [Pseudomonadota bacterium]|nr:BLUF domain-containing protein [Pseudomonadota bacterium]MEE3102048.1 BLUF domain-containing protein [Pseudomonadota bacterium]
MITVADPVLRLAIRSYWRDPPDAVLFDLLRSAERRNRELGCSGALFWGYQSYVQVLEGPEDGLRVLGAAILSDRRHAPLCWSYMTAPDRALAPTLPLGLVDTTEAAGMGLALEVRRMAEAPADDRLLEAAADLVLHMACRKYPAATLVRPAAPAALAGPAASRPGASPRPGHGAPRPRVA